APAAAPSPSAPTATPSPPPAPAVPAATPAKTTEVVENPYGLEALLKGGDLVSRATLGILVLMSLGSCYIIVTTVSEQPKRHRLGHLRRVDRNRHRRTGVDRQGCRSRRRSADHDGDRSRRCRSRRAGVQLAHPAQQERDGRSAELRRRPSRGAVVERADDDR